MFGTFVIIEDHLLFAQALQSLIHTVSGMECKAIVTNGSEAFSSIEEHQPGLIILDLNLPDINGIEVLKQLKKSSTKAPILVISMISDPLIISRAIESGASGFLPKNTNKEELKLAFETIGQHKVYLSESIRKSIEEVDIQLNNTGNQQHFTDLSKREIEIIKLIAKGQTNNEISEVLFISPLTVKTHRNNILRKLDIKNTAALINFAKNTGII